MTTLEDVVRMLKKPIKRVDFEIEIDGVRHTCTAYRIKDIIRIDIK